MDWDIRPYEGAGPLTFDMTPDEVQGKLGKAEKVVPGDEVLYYYGKLGLKLYFVDDKLELIEFVDPAKPTYNGEDLLKLTDPASWIEEQDPDSDDDPPDLQSDKLGIAFYVPDVEHYYVSAFKKGYYDVPV